MGDANLVLVGFMGSGKSTVGRLLAEATGLRLVDTDAELERRTGRSIHQIFASEGEEAFRRLEAEVVRAVAKGRGQVIATGGGVVLRPENLTALKETGLVVALAAGTDLLWERVGACKDRPLIAGEGARERFEELWRLRQPLYAQADVVLETEGLTPDEVAQRVRAHWQLATVPGRVEVQLAERSYPVYVGAGLLAALGAAAVKAATGRKVVVVSDPAVDRLHGEAARRALAAAGRDVVTFQVPEGEAAKRLSVVEGLYRRALAAGVERNDLVVALGGGTVGDSAGFFAATYLRGVPLLQVPTTLLAQVDSSVGGKVGVNLEEGKNLVGAFHQPRLVVADTETLRTLPGREVRAGLAEVAKCGVLGDPELFSRLESWPELSGEGAGRAAVPGPEWAAAICSAVTVKARIVSCDEHETGPRLTLNLGHTAAHAVETATGFGPVKHGEAVAYGVGVATRLAVSLGICPATDGDRILTLLAHLGLPRRREELAVEVSKDALLPLLGRDKKVRRGRVRWVLPRGIGETVITDEVPEALVRECL